MSNLEVELRWFDAEEMCDPLALRDFFAGEHFVPRAVVYLRAVRAVLALEAGGALFPSDKGRGLK